MHPDTRPVGHCPRCGASIVPGHVLIRYERKGDQAMYATCSDCSDVVRPERSV